jgi:hypothetical protein
MLKKVCLVMALCSLPLITMAETCPSLESIHAGNLQGWVALNSTSDNYASKELVAAFEKGAEDFWLAEWTTEYPFPPNMPGRCYYLTPCYVDVYLAKGVPAPSGKNWKENDNIKQCYSQSVAGCAFDPLHK